MIREGTKADIPSLVRMAGDFMATAQLPFEDAYAARSFVVHLEAYSTLTLVLEIDGQPHGVLCGALSDFPLGPARFAVERIFWIDPSARGPWAVRMIKAYEGWAKRHGCAAVNLVTFGAMAAGNLYKRLGYAPAERHFLKEL